MNDTLKVAGRIGAELGAAKAELERLSHKLERARDHLTHARHDVEIRANAGNDAARLVLKGIDQWLSDYDQSPTDTFTAVDMATAAAQGFRDGQAAVEPAPAQCPICDANEVVELRTKHCLKCDADFAGADEMSANKAAVLAARAKRIEPDPSIAACEAITHRMVDAFKVAFHQHQRMAVTYDESVHIGLAAALSARPAQTEQQPVRLPERKRTEHLPKEYKTMTVVRAGLEAYNRALDDVAALNAAPIAQTAPQGKFRMGDRVKKSTGSEWVGRVVGWYSTEQTKEGYAVESSAHRNSVQIYPAKALEAVE